MGTETFDLGGKISLRELVKSKIFRVFSLPYIQAAIALPTVYLVFTQEPLSSPVQAASYVAGINIVVHAISFVAIFALMPRQFCLTVPWKSVAKYVFAGFVAAISLLFAPQTTTLVATFVKVLAGVGVYAALLLMIDVDARNLAKRIMEEIGRQFR